jgi:hypothetical protein
LVRVDGLCFGPDHRRQCTAEAGCGRGLPGGGLAGAAVPVPAARADACSSCPVPTAANSRAMPPSATAASARRCVPLFARAVTRLAAVDGRGATAARVLDAPALDWPETEGAGVAVEVAGGVARPEPAAAAPVASAGFSPGASNACAWVVSKVTVRSMAGFPALAEGPSALGAVRSFEPVCSAAPSWLPDSFNRTVSASAAARARSEKGGCAGTGGRAGIRTTPRLTTTRARHTRSA